VFGFSNILYLVFTEINYVQDPTTEAASKSKKAAGMTTPLSARADDLTSGILIGTYGWLDFGLFSKAIKGFRVVGRYDYVNPDLDFAKEEHHRIVVGIGYKFNKHFSILANTEMTFFGSKAGYDKDTSGYIKPDSKNYVYLHTEMKL